jgi:hypothetical protein
MRVITDRLDQRRWFRHHRFCSHSNDERYSPGSMESFIWRAC